MYTTQQQDFLVSYTADSTISGSVQSLSKMSTLNDERAGELLSSASSVLVHSGNVASWNKLRRKGVLTPTDEVSLALPEHLAIA